MRPDPELAELRRPGLRLGRGALDARAAIDEAVPAHVLAAALFERFSSRGEADFADQLLSAMRFGFGGHVEKEAPQGEKPQEKGPSQ